MTTVSVEQALRLGLDHHRAGRLDDAKAVYVAILKADPQQPDALYLLGQILFEWEHYDHAAMSAAAALAVRPGAFQVWAALAVAREGLGDLAGAQKALQHALALAPDHAPALAALAPLLKGAGRLDRAAAVYRRMAVLSAPGSGDRRYGDDNAALCRALSVGTTRTGALPAVTIIIPCYNYGAYVGEAVDSALAQTYPNLDVVVVDGGSGEETLAVLRTLNRPRTRVLFREGRHLVGSNRNFGIAATASPYICCLDADDALEPDYIEKAVFFLDRCGFDIVSSRFHGFGAKTSRPRWPLTLRPTLANLLQYNQVVTHAVFRRDRWERAGGFHDFGLGADYVYEDWNLWVRMAAQGAEIMNMDERLFRYRAHDKPRITGQQGLKTLEQQRVTIHAFNRDVLGD